MLAFLRKESGASAAEYALILGIVAAALLAAVSLLTTSIQTAISGAAGIVNP
jgi:Flp pilus assembly pilin Flp